VKIYQSSSFSKRTSYRYQNQVCSGPLYQWPTDTKLVNFLFFLSMLLNRANPFPGVQRWSVQIHFNTDSRYCLVLILGFGKKVNSESRNMVVVVAHYSTNRRPHPRRWLLCSQAAAQRSFQNLSSSIFRAHFAKCNEIPKCNEWTWKSRHIQGLVRPAALTQLLACFCSR
jgi:hypothetical protein